jgi:hypothetical protein
MFFMGFSDGIMSRAVQQEALTGLLIEKGDEFLEMVRVVNREMKKKGK